MVAVFLPVPPLLRLAGSLTFTALMYVLYGFTLSITDRHLLRLILTQLDFWIVSLSYWVAIGSTWVLLWPGLESPVTKVSVALALLMDIPGIACLLVIHDAAPVASAGVLWWHATYVWLISCMAFLMFFDPQNVRLACVTSHA